MSLDLANVIPLLTNNGTVKATKTIYEYLSPVDRPLLKQKIAELNSIKAETTTLRGAQKKQWQGDKSKRIGEKFEEVVQVLFKDSEIIKITTNARGVVGEYDIVMTLQPLKNVVPFLQVHTQGYGEAKCHHDKISSEWVIELLGHLTQGGISLGFIFVYTKPKKLPVPTKTALYGVRSGGRAILPLGAKQIQEVIDGTSLLEIIEEMHTLTTVVDADIRV